MREYAFELALCAHREAEFEGLLARQLGASCHGSRVMDVVELVPGPRFGERVALCPGPIPAPVLESDIGPGTARDPHRALDVHSDRVEGVVDAAVAAGYLERERREGRELVRATGRYPGDWVGSIRGIENKPDLGRPGDLERQLRTDISLALLDEVVLATASHVTGAHLNRIPSAVGVWEFDPETGEREVVREPTPLATDAAGVEPLDRHPGRTEVRVVSAAAKRRARRRLAERAFGKGWRPDAAAWPDCARIEVGERGGAGPLPDCPWKGRVVDPASECGPACDGHVPGEAPAVDPEAARADATPWDPDAGDRRQQTGLDRFTENSQ
ncbi:MAG: DUF5787 family protein [Haloglomus sp.]